MRLVRNVLLSLEILAAHKVRTFLSLLGVIVGVAAVVLMASAGKGAEKRILDKIHAMGTNLVVVNAGQTRITAGRQRQMNTVTTLTPKDAEFIARDCDGVLLAAPALNRKAAVRWEDETANTTATGITPEGFAVRNIVAGSGQLFGPDDERTRGRVAVLGPTAAHNLFGEADPLGQRVRIGRVPFEIVAVAAPKGVDTNGLDQDDVILVPLATAMLRLFNVTYVDTVYVQARSSADLDRVEMEIGPLLRQGHRLRDRPDDFTIQNQATLLKTERATTESMTLLVGGVAGISLVVGGFGILAVMIISVRERRREIGLRRAVGANRSDIRNQFLVESGALAATGGVCGVITGLGAAQGLALTGYLDIVIAWPAVAVALMFAVAVGLVFGLYPAVRAARLEPIQALRAD